MTTIINHDIRAVNGKYIILPPWNALDDNAPKSLAIPDPYAQGTPQLYPTATKFIDFDREFRYAYNGSTDTLNEGWGSMCYVDQSEQGTPKANIAAGSTTITMDDVGTFSANAYAGGWLMTKPADGYMYRILSHTVATGSSTVTYTIDRPLGFNVDTTTSATMVVFKNEFADVRKASGVTGGAAGYTTFVGIPLVPILTHRYHWQQTAGTAWIAAADADYGNTAYERSYWFWIDGSVCLASNVGEEGQLCGVGIPFLNTAGSTEVWYVYNVHMFLQIHYT